MKITGGAFAKCLSGKEDALILLFSSVEVCTLVMTFYAKSALFRTVLQELAFFIEKIGRQGTGGTTYKIVPVLARLGTPVIHYERYRLIFRRCSANEACTIPLFGIQGGRHRKGTRCDAAKHPTHRSRAKCSSCDSQSVPTELKLHTQFLQTSSLTATETKY